MKRGLLIIKTIIDNLRLAPYNLIFLSIFITGFLISGDLNGQCACSGTDYGSINVGGWTVGQSANIATNIWAGERSTIQHTVAGAVYRVSSCGASYDTQLTIYTTACSYIAYNDDNGPACSGTRASVDFTSPGGNIFVNLNQYNCNTNTTNTTVSVTLISLPSCSPSGNQSTYGSGSWIGYAYTSNGSGSFETYLGYVTESEIFNRNMGNGSIAGATTDLPCGTLSDDFSIRYR
ncbi:MAG: hypothetical protein EOM05_12795, partial [Clostridia bacterium]|nr:hypothetical protein [Clostridia bacterium]